VLVYDRNLQKLRWLFPATYTALNLISTPANYLILNSPLYCTFFNGFGDAYHDVMNNVYRLWAVQDYGTAVAANTYSGVTWATWALDDENNSLVSWSTIRRLVIVSSQLQVNNESVAVFNSSTARSVNILTDFEIPYNTTTPPNKAYAFYQPSVYRYSDILTDGPIKKLDITVYFENSTDQQLYPLYFPSTSDNYIKIMFKKKIGKKLHVDERDTLLYELTRKGKLK
jgi:hypothetical protein